MLAEFCSLKLPVSATSRSPPPSPSSCPRTQLQVSKYTALIFNALDINNWYRWTIPLGCSNLLGTLGAAP